MLMEKKSKLGRVKFVWRAGKKFRFIVCKHYLINETASRVRIYLKIL